MEKAYKKTRPSMELQTSTELEGSETAAKCVPGSIPKEMLWQAVRKINIDWTINMGKTIADDQNYKCNKH